MPTALDLRGGGSTSPRSTPAIKRPTTYGSLNKEDVSGAGRVAIGISDPSKTLQQSVGNINAGFIGLGKGLVSIAENLPVIGAIAKPVIGVVGSIADNTIGRGVSLLEQVKVGDMNLAQAAAQQAAARRWDHQLTRRPRLRAILVLLHLVELIVDPVHQAGLDHRAHHAFAAVLGVIADAPPTL
jgi:hypothetical protein